MRRIPVSCPRPRLGLSPPIVRAGRAAAPDARQQAAAKTSSAKAKPRPKTAPAKAAPLVPLTERERALQMLDRFTFGPRPGDVDRVLAMGVGQLV